MGKTPQHTPSSASGAGPDITRAEWSTARQNDLPDSSFAYIADGGHKDDSGRTTPRSLRHLPYKDADGKIDAAHVRNALARLDQTDIPAAAKAEARKKLVAAAKKVGVEVSDDDGRVADALVTRSWNDSAEITRVTLPATVRIVDRDKREFEVCATSEAVDSYGTVFGYEATKDAFTRWIGNIREMHAPKAVGRRVQVRFDDTTRKTYVRGRVSRGADDTWLKLEDGVLQGASIGASNVIWEQRTVDGHTLPYATKYDLVELSLVDNPSNPDALGINFVRAALLDEQMLDELPEETRVSVTQPEDLAAMAPEVSGPQLGAVTGVPSVDMADVALRAAAQQPAPAASPAASDASASAAGVAADAPQLPLPDRSQVSAGIQASLDQQAERERKARYVRAAGEAAVKDLAPWNDKAETYDQYIYRVRQVAAPAEARALLEYTAGTPSVMDTVAPSQTQQPGDPATADSAPADATRAPAIAAPPSGNGIVQSQGGEPREPALGTDRGQHLHTHEHSSSHDLHSHAHEHRHGDGTVHSHPHLHDHTHSDDHYGDGTRAAGSAQSHSHEHTHAHDHMHTYRAGQPTDSRLLTPGQSRAPLGSPSAAIAADGGHPAGAILQTGASTGDGTGSNGSVSPVISTQPQFVGSRVLYNTEDAASLDAGVPQAADQRPTPGGDLMLDGAQFHEGGHREAHGDATGEYDHDGDHDGDAADSLPAAGRPGTPAATTMRPAADTPSNSGTPASSTVVPTPGRRAAAATDDRSLGSTGGPDGLGIVNTLSGAAANATPEGDDDDSGDYADVEGFDGDADDVQIASRPPRATPIVHDAAATPEVGKDPSDTSVVLNVTGPLPTGGATGVDGGARSVASAQETRVGARISEESRSAIHEMRDDALSAVKKACAHCDCPECQRHMAVINGGLYDATGDHSSADDQGPDMSDDTGTFGQLRVMQARFMRALTEQRQAFEQQLAQQRAELLHVLEEMNTAIGDAQATLVDHQRGYASQVTRAVTAQLESQVVERVQQLVAAPMLQRLEAVAEVASGLKADVERVEGAVERIAMQPASGNGPVAGISDKQSPFAPPSSSAAASYGYAPQLGVGPNVDQSVQQQLAALALAGQMIDPADTATRSAIAGKMAQLSQHSILPR